ncbi:MAG: hypothetical protein QM784_10525 [Polyangiaceae bacterium]
MEFGADKITPLKRSGKKTDKSTNPTESAKVEPEIAPVPDAPTSEASGHIGPGGTRAALTGNPKDASASESVGDKAAAFGTAAAEGAAGAVIGGVITSLAVGAFCGPAAPICTGVAMGGLLLAGVASFVMSGAAQQVVESGKNIAQGTGTAKDWGVAGGVTGTLLGGVILGKLGGASEAGEGGTKPSLGAHKKALRKVHEELGGSLPPGKPGKYGSPQRGTPRKGYRLDPGHPDRPPGDLESGPHINWWDFSGGKKGKGGRYGAVPIE